MLLSMVTPSPRRPGQGTPPPRRSLPLPGPDASVDEILDWARSRLSPEVMEALGSPDNPPHGEPGHRCGTEELTGMPISQVIDMLADNTPVAWVLMTPDERKAAVQEWVDGFLGTVRAAGRLSNTIPDGADIPKKLLVIALQHGAMDEGKGKPPKLILDALGVSEGDFPPAVVAEWDRRRAAFLKSLREEAPPGLAGDLPGSDDVLAALAADAVPDGRVVYDGLLIPAEVADTLKQDEERWRREGPWTGDNPFRAEFGANPFITLELSDVDVPNMMRLSLHIGGGAEDPHYALAMLRGAYDEMQRRIRAEGHGGGSATGQPGDGGKPA